MTAVEYIREKLLGDEYWHENMTFDQIFEQAKQFDQIFEQAKQMEKEKLKDAYDAGVWDVGCKAPNFDEYYKRTFKQE